MTPDVESLLNFALQNGIIDVADVNARIEMKRRNDLLQLHNSKIWQGKTNGRWYTYLTDENGKKVLKAKSTREELENMLVDYYKERNECLVESTVDVDFKICNPTVGKMFIMWLQERMEYDELERSTYTRYLNDYNRFFKEFGSEKIEDVDSVALENFVRYQLKTIKMSKKAFSNFRTLIYGIFRYARKHGYTELNAHDVISDMTFSKKQFSHKKKDDHSEIFFQDEEEMITDYILNNINTKNLGILLIFKTGLRVGELVALKPDDIFDNVLSIHRTETFYTNSDGIRVYDVKDTTKTDAGMRDVIVPESAKWIISKLIEINDGSEYLLSWKGERLKGCQVQKQMYRICDILGIKRRSPHKVRKTYGTKLYDSGVTQSLIISQMGHTDISCLQKHYYYNRQDFRQKMNEINNVMDL